MSIRSVREYINLRLYGQKPGVLRAFRIITLFVSIIAIITLINYHGFPQDPESEKFLLNIIKGSFAFFIFHYLLRIFYDFHPLKFIRGTWFEGLLMLVLIIDGFSDIFFHVQIIEKLFVELGFTDYEVISTTLIQLYLFSIILIHILRTTTILPKIKINPSIIFISSFLFIIAMGSFLLLLPEMTTNGISFIDALFTSTSATCVTGLTVIETATSFTQKGQFVILVLLKLGGLNIVMFGTFLALASKFGLGIKHHQVIEGFMSKNSIFSAQGMMTKIFFWSLSIEMISSALLYLFWQPVIPFKNIEEKIFFSVFHAMSAFNNAGFSIFEGGFVNEMVRQNYLAHIVIASTIFLGSLGFIAMFDLFSLANLRNRLRIPWKNVEISTQISLNYSIVLVIAGALVMFLLEYDRTLKDTNFLEGIITSVFQSVSTRTAGFNTVDIGKLATPVLIIFMFLMFIGASSSSTGGGVKTSSIALLLASVYCTIRGKKNVELFRKTIPPDLINSAIAIILFYCFYILISLFLLSITEMERLAQHGLGFIDLMFEQISAMSTVGLSTGVTSLLSGTGKVLIILSMFVGRVGAITLVFAVAKRIISTNYKYPTERLMIG